MNDKMNDKMIKALFICLAILLYFSIPVFAGTTVIQVETDEGGNIDTNGDGIYENVNGAIFWNGTEYVTNDTYGHMYFEATEDGYIKTEDGVDVYVRAGDRIGNYGGDHTTSYSGGGNNVNVGTPVEVTGDINFNIMHNTFTYTKNYNGVDYEVTAAEFHYQYVDSVTMQSLGTLAIVRSRAADINGTLPYFDVYIKNGSYSSDELTATFEAFLGDPKWYSLPTGLGFDGAMALSGTNLDSFIRGDFVTPGADYYVDSNGGSEMGGMTFKLTTADFIGADFMGMDTAFISEFDFQFKNREGKLQFEGVLPYVYSVLALDNPASSPVPEPATIALFGIGLLGIAGIGRRKK